MLAETLKLAWRNIWRNRRRTLITGAAIGIGLAAMIITLGYMEGMVRHFASTVTESLSGEAQIHATGFRDAREVEQLIPRGDEVLAQALALRGVRAATPRVYAPALLAIGDRAANVQLIGVDPLREASVSDWRDRLVAGGWISSPGDAIIGWKLAEKLDVEKGARVVLTLAEAGSGEIQALLLRICGVVGSNDPRLNGGSVVMSIGEARDLIGLDGGCHEITLRFDAPLDTHQATDLLAPLAAPGLEIMPWQKLQPWIATMLDMQDIYLAITVAIIFGLIALGIVNTMGMAFLERTHEFGVLKALGTAPGNLSLLLFCEAGSLGLVGTAIGLALGLLVHWPVSIRGWVMGDTQFAGMTMSSRLYPVLEPLPVVVLCAVFVLLTMLVGLSAAVRAARLSPQEALRHE